MRSVFVLLILGLAIMCLPSAEGDDLYESDFESFSLGTINGQDGWSVGDGSGTSTDGMIVDDGTGNQVLEVVAGSGWGDEVRRAYDSTSARRYLLVTMRTRDRDGGAPFWLMDNYHPGPHSPDTVFWVPSTVSTNADPGGSRVSFLGDTWHDIGVEIDQDGRSITALMVDGVWYPEDDSNGMSPPGGHSNFHFGGIGAEERLWIDDLSITDSDVSSIEKSKSKNIAFVFANEPHVNRICEYHGPGLVFCSDVASDTNDSWVVALGDLDGMNGLDAVFVNQCQSNRVCLNDGASSFVCGDLSPDMNCSRGVALGDMNGSDGVDIMIANNPQPNRVCLNDGSGTFSCSDIDSETNETVGVAVGDLDGMNGPDAVFANHGQENRVCLNDGTGLLTCSDVSADTNYSMAVALADLDGVDGLDAVFANNAGPSRVCLNNSAGSFTCSDVSPETNGPGVAMADVDGDHDVDVVFANQSQENRICLNDGSGSFSCGSVSSDSFESNGVATVDLDSDNDVDLVFANYGQENRACLNDGTGSFACTAVGSDYHGSRGVAAAVIDTGEACAPSNLVAFWPAEGSGIDVAGAWAGTLDGGVTFGPGKVGQAFSFDGVDDQVTLNSFPTASSFTIEGWVYYLGTGTPPWAAIYADSEHGFFLNDRRLSWYDYGGRFTGNTQIPVAEWHHVAITYDSNATTLSGYIDGMLEGTSTFAGATLPPGNPDVSIGGWGHGADCLEGMIDELTVYDRVLAASEILAISNFDSAGKCLLFRGDFEIGGVSRWSLFSP